MKRIIFILLCSFGSLISCGDDDSSSASTPDSNLSVKIDNTDFVFDDISVVRTPYEDEGIIFKS